MKIILVGYMGSGKSTIGKKLSLKINLPFFDLDKEIEKKYNQTIDEIFKTKGEIWFRKLEHQLLSEYIQSDKSFILSLGGGTPCYANNHLFLQLPEIYSIYLKASVSELTNRLEKEKDQRPLLQNIEDLSSFIGPHILERSHYYNFAKYKVQVDGNPPDEIVSEIIKLMG